MIKRITLAIFSIVSSIAGNAQSTLGVFTSVPVGEFGSTNLPSGGFAKTGWGIKYGNNWYFTNWSPNLSIAYRISYQENELDNARLAEAYTGILNRPTHVDAAKYRPIIITLGPRYQIDVSNKIKLLLRGGLGIMWSNVDSFLIEVRDNNNAILFSEVLDFRATPTFTYTLGVTFDYRLSESYSLGIFADASSATEKVNARLGTLPNVESSATLSFINIGLSITQNF